MQQSDKLRVLLQHWIDHNKGHAAEFSRWQAIMSGEDKSAAAGHIGEAIATMEQVNEHLGRALDELGGAAPHDGHHHHDDHHHHHHE